MDGNLFEIIDRLAEQCDLSDEEFLALLQFHDDETDKYLYKRADEVRRRRYGTDVYIRGLIEFTNYCKNGCYYCGINCANTAVSRYRLTKEEILACCRDGYNAGFRTFVLQGGEDPYFTDDIFCDIIAEIKRLYPDCALTLSFGEKSEETYRRYFSAGADRYLLRHETADNAHYHRLHPENLSPEYRKNCLYTLKKIGFQTGAGVMVGSPYQTRENLVKDIRFLQDLKPQMVGIGPFIPHKDTIFHDKPQGALRDTLVMLSLTRLILPTVLLPATTALATIHPQGREMGLSAGGNVVMPNLSPERFRRLYSLYDNKLSSGAEAGECRRELEERCERAGYHVVTDRGDYRPE